MMRKFSELKKLTAEQERFVDENMYAWGAWVRSGRIDKVKLNIIAKLMQSAIPTEPGEPMCDDDTEHPQYKSRSGFLAKVATDRIFAM